jgi:hypothetical protein
MFADTQADFVHNYQAFWNSISKIGYLSLYGRAISGTVDVYYMDCTAFNVLWKDRVAAEIGLKICIPAVDWV